MEQQTERKPDNRQLVFKLTVDQANALVNILNTPLQVPSIVFANFIMLLQDQAGPQIEALNMNEAKTDEQPAETE